MAEVACLPSPLRCAGGGLKCLRGVLVINVMCIKVSLGLSNCCTGCSRIKTNVYHVC